MGLQHLKTNYPTQFIGNSVNHEQIKVRAFHDHGVVVVNVNDLALSWVDREELNRIASKLYGPRLTPMRCRR